MIEAKQIDAVEKLRDDAGAEQVDLPREQQVPDGVVLVGERLPSLRDDIVLPMLDGPRLGLQLHWDFLRLWNNKKPAERGAGGSEAGEMSLVARQLVPTSRR
jgi:hypothetical protein